MSGVYFSNDDISILSLLTLIGPNCVHILASFLQQISLPPHWEGFNDILRPGVSSSLRRKKCQIISKTLVADDIQDSCNHLCSAAFCNNVRIV